MVNVVAFLAAGLYRSRLCLSLLDDLPYLAAAVLVGYTLKLAVFGFIEGVDG